MKSELTIKNFKRIEDEIKFSDFAYVNYFVGQNGCGKTSVLNAISYLNEVSTAIQFFGPNSNVNFQIDGKIRRLFWNAKNQGASRTQYEGDLESLIFYLISNLPEEKGAIRLGGHGKFDEKITINDQKSLDYFNDFIKDYKLEDIVAKKIVDQSNPFDKDSGKLVFENSNGKIDPTMIADGLKVLFNLKKRLDIWLDAINANYIFYFLIIEEPETNLHPDFQKKIPMILDDFYNRLDPSMKDQVYFFISTHSPFLISSSANYQNQKVYPMQNGKPLQIDFSNLTYIEAKSSDGFSGSESAFVVGKMLGADITDLGYPENYVILEEYSLQIILDDLRSKGIIKNIQFVSAAGASKSIDLSEKIYEIEKLNTLIKCNPYYFDKYFLVIDQLDTNIDNKILKRITSISKRLGSRFVQLSQLSLEDYYKNIDQNIYDDYQKEIIGLSSNQIGIIKAKYATKISKLISNKTEFSRLFSNELDFLI